MKKLILFLFTVVATMASCGNRINSNSTTIDTTVDTTVDTVSCDTIILG